jgi:FkbM family methyltransferase
MINRGPTSVPRKFLSLANMLRFIASHPLNSAHKIASMRRFFAWQISSRLAPGPIAFNFVNNAMLLVEPGMTGATGNVYTGLHEFEDMSFVLHLLRAEDVFVDVGANIGSYTILAGAVVGAKCVSFEPILATYRHLIRNINLNGIGQNVIAENIGIGNARGELRFTATLDTVNHVLGENEESHGASVVLVKTLDEALEEIRPTLIKIDVEGFESSVIEGAPDILRRESLLAVVMELNGSGARYGFDELALHEKMLQYDFRPFAYFPFIRKLTPLSGKNSLSGNTIYIRDFAEAQRRVTSASPFVVSGMPI